MKIDDEEAKKMRCPKCKREVIKKGYNWFLKDLPIMSHSISCNYNLEKKEK